MKKFLDSNENVFLFEKEQEDDFMDDDDNNDDKCIIYVDNIEETVMTFFIFDMNRSEST